MELLLLYVADLAAVDFANKTASEQARIRLVYWASPPGYTMRSSTYPTDSVSFCAGKDPSMAATSLTSYLSIPGETRWRQPRSPGGK